MNINTTNFVRAFEYNRNNTSPSITDEKKNSYELSIDVTEKFEPGEKNSGLNNFSTKTRPQYDPTAPVVKTDMASKDVLEVIHYEDVLEKAEAESQNSDKLIPQSDYIQPSLETTKEEIGKGFYLTIPKSDLEKMSKYTKGKQDKLEKYNPGKKAKTGVLVNLLA